MAILIPQKVPTGTHLETVEKQIGLWEYGVWKDNNIWKTQVATDMLQQVLAWKFFVSLLP